MQKFLLFSAIWLICNSLQAFSSNNTCLPVLGKAVDQLVIINDIVKKTLEDTVPKITDQIESVKETLEAIRKLAEERTAASFIFPIVIGASFVGVLFGTLTWMMLNLSKDFAQNKWQARKAAAAALASVVAGAVLTEMDYMAVPGDASSAV